MVPQDRYSDDAVRNATGQGWDHWFRILDGFDADLDHTARAKALSEAAPTLSGWWMQGITVEYERERGLRQFGESSTGGFQVSCSKTVESSAEASFERVVAAPWLPGADWTEGAQWDTDGGRVEVRIVKPGKQLRFWWFDEAGKSTVIVAFVATKAGKTQIVIAHEGLPSAEAREAYRERWKVALDLLVA